MNQNLRRAWQTRDWVEVPRIEQQHGGNELVQAALCSPAVRHRAKVAREAIRVYIEQTSRRELLDQILDEELPRYAEALKRLGE